MNQKSMTAIISMFVCWYHSKNNDVKIFNDFIADLRLTEEEKVTIEEKKKI